MNLWDLNNPGGCSPPRRFKVESDIGLNFVRIPNNGVVDDVLCRRNRYGLVSKVSLTCSKGLYNLDNFKLDCDGDI